MHFAAWTYYLGRLLISERLAEQASRYENLPRGRDLIRAMAARTPDLPIEWQILDRRTPDAALNRRGSCFKQCRRSISSSNVNAPFRLILTEHCLAQRTSQSLR